MGKYLSIARQVLTELREREGANPTTEYQLTVSERLLRDTLSRIEELADNQPAAVRCDVAVIVARHGRTLGEVFLRGDDKRVVSELQAFEKSVQPRQLRRA